jgi:hypothetical protein
MEENGRQARFDSGFAHHHGADFRVAEAGDFIQAQLADVAGEFHHQILDIFAR